MGRACDRGFKATHTSNPVCPIHRPMTTRRMATHWVAGCCLTPPPAALWRARVKVWRAVCKICAISLLKTSQTLCRWPFHHSDATAHGMAAHLPTTQILTWELVYVRPMEMSANAPSPAHSAGSGKCKDGSFASSVYVSVWSTNKHACLHIFCSSCKPSTVIYCRQPTTVPDGTEVSRVL